MEHRVARRHADGHALAGRENPLIPGVFVGARDEYPLDVERELVPFFVARKVPSVLARVPLAVVLPISIVAVAEVRIPRDRSP